ncbi:MAG: SdrD B-like domain-containing protein, partial [Terracoccus sp.]
MTAAGASAVLLGALVVAVPVAVAPVAAAATTNDLKVSVVSARTVDATHRPAGAVTKGDAVPTFKYMINVDNSGIADPAGSPKVGSGCSPEDTEYPASCQWPSINQAPGAAPIYRQGDETDFAGGAALADLPDGRYLITTLADDYKIDGTHFTVPMEGDGTVTVAMQPTPLPDATLRAQVYLDEATTNMAIDNGERGLEGFQGHINDTLGEITTDVYGNPLCTTYVGEKNTGANADYSIPWNATSRETDGSPIVDTIGGKCFSDATGMLVIPHLGTNRYTTTVSPPDGSSYIQTTTLEGNHDFDTWLMEGATGFDTESTVAGEPVPTPQFGFVDASAAAHPALGGSGTIKGVVVGVKQYYPPTGGSFNYYLGMTGSKLDKPIESPVLSLNDLENGDQAVWVGRGGADGSFTIPNVPDGNYSLSWWDEPQNYILQIVNVTVSNGETVDLKQLPLNGWWTQLSGHVFNDLNGNGRRDTGEPGIAQFPLTLRKNDNSLMDRGSNAVASDSTGYYSFDGAYPLSEWTVLEAYSDSFHTTGVTYQTDNQPTPTTIRGAGVDLSTLNIIGLSATVDWGVQPYARGTNGGIVGSISYDTTRNELDPRYAASEDWQPGIPNIPVELHATVDCGTTVPAVPCDASETYELAPDGSYKQGDLLNTYVSEHWSRPTDCTARDVDGTVLTHPGDEDVLVKNQSSGGECLAALVQGMQVGSYATDQGTAAANFGASVDGNYGFGDACYKPNTIDATDPGAPTCVDAAGQDAWAPLQGAYEYLVSVDIPNDASGKPMYQATGEEDINIGHGDQIVPQVPPPACAGPLHTVDVAGVGTDGYPATTGDGTNGAPTGVTVPGSAPVDNPTFVDIGGSPYEGMPKPTCDTKLVQLNNGKSVVPMFNLFTDVPIPSRLRGLIVDDLNFSTDKRTTLYGDKAGLPNAPVGIYDYSNRLVYTAESDFNGYYDVLMPSTDHINCPTPSGVCTNVYRFVGNDPGVPGALNADYNPRFRTIATEFEAMPGVTIPTDLAPTQVGVSIGTPGTLQNVAVSCPVNPVSPQVFAVDKAVVPSAATGTGRQLTVNGLGFGATQGVGTIKLGPTTLSTTTWTDTQIVATVPAVGTAAGQITAGPLALTITGDNGKKSVNGLTVHVLGGSYTPTVLDVGPGVSVAKYDPTKAASHTGTRGVSHAIQNAIDAASGTNGTVVVVHPNTATAGNPRGAYYENLVVDRAVKLQGLGAGGFQGPNANSPYVAGTILDGGAFGGDTDLASDWFTKVGAMTWVGNQTVSDGAVVYLLARSNSTYTGTFTAAIDGFDIRGGDQQGFPGNINDLTGQPTGLPANIITQGGAIFANAYVKQLQVTNNVVENNGGGYGTIRIGTPELAAPQTNQHNEGVRIADNRIVQNAGTNLAGAIGLFAGSDGYEVARNDICGNFALEYGGGISVYGYSPGGSIHHNRVTLNSSNDEGGGIMIAGQLPATPGTLSPGTGKVDIYANLIQGNLSNDDGGGIRFLMAGNSPMNVYDNMIVNNVSTHEGGGVGINDAPDVRIYNNTIMKNLTTATAVTSNGTAAPAGVSTSANSDPLQATLPAGSSSFSNPLLFNNILWDNRAGTRAGTTVTGLGLAGDADVNHWDVGVADGTGVLAPTSSVIQQVSSEHAYTASASNKTTDPKVVTPFDLSVSFATWRQNPAFVDATVVAFEKPADQMGDYHLQACAGTTTPACDTGAASAGGVTAPGVDIDGDARPSGAAIDMGADEVVVAPPSVNADRFFFSTAGKANPPGVTGTPDNSDIYRWNNLSFNRSIDATAAATALRNNANVDGFSRVDKDH